MNDAVIICALKKEFFPCGLDVEVRYSGVGKVNAAIAAMEVICSRPKVTRIINVGTCGSLTQDRFVGRECAVFLDRDGSGFDAYDPISFGGYGLRCSTGDSFVTDDKDVCADVVDMEAYAIAKVCNRYGIGFRCFKFVTDVVGDNSTDDWMDHISDGQEYFEKVIREAINA